MDGWASGRVGEWMGKWVDECCPGTNFWVLADAGLKNQAEVLSSLFEGHLTGNGAVWAVSGRGERQK